MELISSNIESDDSVIRIPRCLREHWLWNNAKYLKWWLTLVMMAQEADECTKFIGRRRVTLKRGQLAISVRDLAQIFACSKNTVVTFLRSLREEGMIRREIEHKITITEISDYDKYCCRK